MNGVPDIDVMPSNYVMADDDAKYTLTKAQYSQVLKRDSQSLFLYGKLSKSYLLKEEERILHYSKDKIVVANYSKDKISLFKRLLSLSLFLSSQRAVSM